MTECDALNIHGIGKVQTFGYIVSFDKTSMEVSHVSANIPELSFSEFNDPTLFVGSLMKDCFIPEVTEVMSTILREYTKLSNSSRNTGSPKDSSLRHGGKLYSVILDETLSEYVFEIFQNNSEVELYSDLMETILVASNREDLYEKTCRFIAENIGYDRAIVYMFSDDLSGKVEHEWIKPSMQGVLDPFMGMHFPESDIPLPARMMYLTKPVRVISDTLSKPVDVLGHSPLNLSRCISRSSHDVHMSYMKNMGIRSSMSLGIVSDGDLQGIISFHSYHNVVKPTTAMIRMVEGICKPFSIVLQQDTIKEDLNRERSVMLVADDIFKHKDVKHFFSKKYADLLLTLQADCVSLYDGTTLKSWGETGISLPQDFSVMNDMYSGDSGDSRYCGRLENPPRGVMYLVHGRCQIIIYRSSKDTETSWGGDPNHVKIMRPDGVPGPRGSFERYLVDHKSMLKPWAPVEERMFSLFTEKIRVFQKLSTTNQTFTGDPGNSIVMNSLGKTSLESFLLTHLSHELMTPLTGISNAMNIVLTDNDISREEMVAHMESGLDCVDMMHKAIRAVMTTPSIEGGKYNQAKLSEELSVSSMKVIVASLVSKYSHETKNLGIEFSAESNVDVDHDLVADNYPSIIKSIMSVIENSLRFTKSGGSIHVSVSVRSTLRETVLLWKEATAGFRHRSFTNIDSSVNIPDSKCWYKFTITDSGVGIHQDMMDGVIGVIHNSSDVPHEIQCSHQGVGIGLYKGLMDVLNINGTVAIASSLGKGTSISFFIPLSVKRRKLTNKRERNAFFIVDDSKLNRMMTSKLVQMACKKIGVDFDIEVFPDGQTCMQRVLMMKENGEQPIGILMDYHMPVMSGKDATKYIRKAEVDNTERIPIMGYSADVTERTRQDLIESGMDCVIPKPLTMEVLMNTLSKITG